MAEVAFNPRDIGLALDVDAVVDIMGCFVKVSHLQTFAFEMNLNKLADGVLSDTKTTTQRDVPSFFHPVVKRTEIEIYIIIAH